MKQVWKLPLQSVSYPSEPFTVSTSGDYIGKDITLKHSYFSMADIRAVTEDGIELSVSNSLDKADFILMHENTSLSKVIGSKVYKGLRINSTKALNKVITIWASYVCDVLDPEDLGQPLHPSAEVRHKSIETFESKTAMASSGYFEVMYHMDLPEGGYINEDGIFFKSDKLRLNKVVLGQEGISFPENPSISHPKGKLSFNGLYWDNVIGDKRHPILTINPEVATHAGFLVWSKYSPSSVSTLSWMKVDDKNKTLKVDAIEAKVRTEEIKIGEFTLKVDHSGDLNINDTIKIDAKTKKVSIGSIVFNKELIELLSYLKDLKNRGI